MRLQDVYEEDGWSIRRDPEVIGHLQMLLANTAGLREAIDGLEPEEQSKGAGGGFHFGGVHRPTDTPVLIKLGSSLSERYWMEQMCRVAPGLVPSVYATGDRLGDLDLGWIVLERVECHHLGPQWEGNEFDMLLDAAAHFQVAARQIPMACVERIDLERLRAFFDEGLFGDGLVLDQPGPTEVVVHRLEEDFEWVCSVCRYEVCHGDIQMNNGLALGAPPGRCPLLLVDPLPKWQPWAFDAGYLQAINSEDRKRKGYTGLVRKLAHYRMGRGLEICSEADLDRLEKIAVGWYAIWCWDSEDAADRDYAAEVERYVSESAAL